MRFTQWDSAWNLPVGASSPIPLHQPDTRTSSATTNPPPPHITHPSQRVRVADPHSQRVPYSSPPSYAQLGSLHHNAHLDPPEHRPHFARFLPTSSSTSDAIPGWAIQQQQYMLIGLLLLLLLFAVVCIGFIITNRRPSSLSWMPFPMAPVPGGAWFTPSPTVH